MRHCRRAPPTSSDDRSASPAMWRTSSMASPAEMSSPATFSASATVRTLWSSRMLASHNGYHSFSATSLTTFVGHVVVQQHQVEIGVRQQLAAAQAAGRDDREAAGRGDPDLGSLGDEPEFVQVEQCVAQRGGIQVTGPPETSCLARRRKIGARPSTRPPPAPPIEEAPAADSGFCSVISSPPPAFTDNAHGARPGDDVSIQLRIKGRRTPARRCGPGPRCRPG